MSFSLDPTLIDLFRSTTADQASQPEIRAILVQTSPTVKKLETTSRLSPSASDKEDFETRLPTLFTDEPTRSGYALFRLDSQAANGDWEWLCIAYQPDGAKVKEKMQYTATRTALLSGLDEHRFLETVYVAGPKDITFPQKLRNARKHDYQNPQEKRRDGMTAADAAGMSVGGARRTFGAKPVGGQVGATPAGAKSNDKEEKTLKEVNQAATTSAAPLAAVADTAAPSAAGEDDASASIAPSANGIPAAESSDIIAGQKAAAEEESISAQPPAEESARPTAPPASATSKTDLPAEASEQAADESKAPEEPPTPAPVAVNSGVPTAEVEKELSKPLVPSPETAKRQLTDDNAQEAANIEVSQPKEQPEAKATEEEKTIAQSESEASQQKPTESSKPAAAATAVTADKASATTTAARSASPSASASSSTPLAVPGTADPSSSSPTASQFPSSSSANRPLTWSSESEAALSGLASRISGSSEHNFVPLRIEVATRLVSLASTGAPPRFVPPGDLEEAVKAEVEQKEEGQLSLVVYRYPVEVNARKVAFLYSGAPSPSASITTTLRAKLIEEVQDKAADLSGLEIERASLSNGSSGASAAGGAGSGAAGGGASYGPYPRPSPSQEEEVSRRISDIQNRVAQACSSSGKAARLVAISKLHPPSSIMAALRLTSQTHFGENYVQELCDKARVLPREVKWHFVGGLQSNKAKLLAAVPNLWCVETLDSAKAASGLEKALTAEGGARLKERKECGLGRLRVLIQVNTSGEEAKSGVSREGDELEKLARHIMTECPNLRLAGLMTIGSAANSKAAGSDGKTLSRQEALEANPDFKALDDAREVLVRALRADPPSLPSGQEEKEGDDDNYSSLLSSSDDTTGGLELSMGMTADFEVAIAAGSGNVRVGTACFGQRPGSRDEARKGMEEELSMSVNTAGGGQVAGGEAEKKAGGSGAGVVGEKGFARPRRPGGKK